MVSNDVRITGTVGAVARQTGLGAVQIETHGLASVQGHQTAIFGKISVRKTI